MLWEVCYSGDGYLTRGFAYSLFGLISFVALIARSLIHERERCVPFANERHDYNQRLSSMVSVRDACHRATHSLCLVTL